MLTFLLNFIPNIGSMVAIVMPIPIILVDPSLSVTAKTFAVLIPTLVQGFVGNVLEPVLFGSTLNLSPISILIALVLFSAMWGLSGAILAVPLLAITRILLHRTDHPLAKRVVSIIRDTPMDELVALQKKREAMFRPMRRGVQRLVEKQHSASRLSLATSRQESKQRISCCWVEYKSDPNSTSLSSM